MGGFVPASCSGTKGPPSVRRRAPKCLREIRQGNGEGMGCCCAGKNRERADALRPGTATQACLDMRSWVLLLGLLEIQLRP